MTQIGENDMKLQTDQDLAITTHKISLVKSWIGKSEVIGTAANEMRGVSHKTTESEWQATIRAMKRDGDKLSGKQGVFYQNAAGEKVGSHFDTTIEWIASEP